MSRQVRRVPMDYRHPKNENGHYVPLFEAEATERPKAQRMPKPRAEDAELGWCMYETVSEGTPISPVKATKEELATWLAETGASAFADQTASYGEWLRMIERGYAVTAATGPDGAVTADVKLP